MSGFDINTVTVSGNLTREPEVRNLPSGTAVCSLRIAHNDRYKDASGEWADRTAYFDVTIWGGLGQWMGNNLTKGQKVVVSGELRWREWENEGQKRQAVDITAFSVVPVVRDGDSRGAGGQSNGYAARSDVPTDMSDFQQQPATVGGGGSRPPADDDIPF